MQQITPPHVDELSRELTNLIMDCPELTELEGLLSRFNVFRVLRADKHELRHSNMLAWLLDPAESHGLGETFLRRWLMHLAHEVGNRRDEHLNWPSPIEIDAEDFDEVEVAREIMNIDLLVSLRLRKGKRWIVCIENKVESAQHTDQLRRYRTDVERRFSDAEHRSYVFLTKYDEVPEVAHFLPASYMSIRNTLLRCIQERQDTIGTEPKFLISQYLELLGDDFVEQNRASELAQKIYRRHKRAIDFILEMRRDPISEGTTAMETVLRTRSDALGIEFGDLNKGRVRYVPKEWAIPSNLGGTAWSCGRYVVFEICFWTKTVELHLVVGKAPDEWANMIWQEAAKEPFKQEWKKRPAQYVKPYKSRSSIRIEAFADMDPTDLQSRLEDWIKEEMAKPAYRKAIELIAPLLFQLKSN